MARRSHKELKAIESFIIEYVDKKPVTCIAEVTKELQEHVAYSIDFHSVGKWLRQLYPDMDWGNTSRNIHQLGSGLTPSERLGFSFLKNKNMKPERLVGGNGLPDFKCKDKKYVEIKTPNTGPSQKQLIEMNNLKKEGNEIYLFFSNNIFENVRPHSDIFVFKLIGKIKKRDVFETDINDF